MLFVGKVIYLLSPENGVASSQEEAKEEEQRENGQEDDNDEEREAKEKDEDDRPPSLMWLIKKLSLMAKREAAYTPKVPLKVPQQPLTLIHSFSKQMYVRQSHDLAAVCREHVCLSSWGRWPWTSDRNALARICPPSSLLCTGSWTAPTQTKVMLFLELLVEKRKKFRFLHTVASTILFRSNAEEPGPGADRAAKETSGAGEVLSRLLRCPERVCPEASGAQTPQGHTGATDAEASRASAVYAQQSAHGFFLLVSQAVANPDIAAKKKMKKHKNKIEAKKRKIELLRPGYKAKRQRSNTLKDLAMVQ